MSERDKAANQLERILDGWMKEEAHGISDVYTRILIS
jgi:hypothetical protein